MKQATSGVQAKIKRLSQKILQLERELQALRILVGSLCSSAPELPVEFRLGASRNLRIDAPPAAQLLLRRLSPREFQVLRLFSKILTCKKIATALGTEPQTVRNQLASARGKLGASSTEHLLEIVIGLRPWLNVS